MINNSTSIQGGDFTRNISDQQQNARRGSRSISIQSNSSQIAPVRNHRNSLDERIMSRSREKRRRTLQESLSSSSGHRMPTSGSSTREGQQSEIVSNKRKKLSIEANIEEDADLDPHESRKTFQKKTMKFIQNHIKDIVESPYAVMIMCTLTIWSLFSDDFRVLLMPKDADVAIEGITAATFLLFILEIIMLSAYNQSYFNIPEFPPDALFSELLMSFSKMGSFYFKLDCVATLTLICEMHWITRINITSFSSMLTKAGVHLIQANIAYRLVRLFRILKLIRMSKLYKYITVYYKDVEGSIQRVSLSLSPRSAATEEPQRRKDNKKSIQTESHVGAALSDLTNRRVIVLIFSMLVLIPFCMIYDESSTEILATNIIHGLGVLNRTDPATYSFAFDRVLANTIDETYVIGIQLDSNWYYHDSIRFDSLRKDDILTYTITSNNYDVSTYFNQRSISEKAAFDGIIMTLFIACLLLLSTLSFSREVNRLVIVPIDRMVSLVKKISENPLGVEYKVLGEKDGFVEGMETTILLATITKIGGLMKVGFGEAGASIIARNLADSTGGKLNLMGAGTRIRSIFGLCDIRQFTDTTECLQEEVMLFVNRISHIVHGIVAQCGGSVNKNIGDAFLLTWKLDDSSIDETLLADQALLAFCKSLVELARHQSFICDFTSEASSKLYLRMPGYKVKIGFGLHVGWAIEGAIGSNRKMDASYLSPHVSFTEFLESSTKHYGVAMLLSGPFYDLLSPEAKRFCREIDRVRRREDLRIGTVHGHRIDKMGLYTYDVDLDINWGNVDNRRNLHSLRQHLGRRTSRRMRVSEYRPRSAEIPSDRRNRSLPIAIDETNDVTDGTNRDMPTIRLPAYGVHVWMEDEDLIDQRKRFDGAFREAWTNGFKAFILGEWQVAKEYFNQTLEMTNNNCEPELRSSTRENMFDGPSLALLNFIEKHGGEAPSDWAGYSYDY